MAYFASLSLFTALQTGQIVNLSQIQSYVNLAINGVLFGYLSWIWLERKLKKYYLPLALITATIVPLFSNLIYLASPQESAQLTIFRSWLLFPILIVPLVLTAWQYKFRIVVAFILLTSVIELTILFSRLQTINFETLPILGVPLIRAFAFGTIGHIVTRLIDTQSAQQKKLVDANIKLNEYADTLEQLTTSRERNRLARDLHDTLAHTLSGLTVNLESIKILLGTDHPEISSRIDHALENTRNGLTDTRRALSDLRAKQVEDLGLPLALASLTENAAVRGNFDAHIILPDSMPELPADIEEIYYRITKESLENVVKHSQAKKVSLVLSNRNHILELMIEDDGVGFDVIEGPAPDTLGIQGMKERAAEKGSSLTIQSTPNQGTQIKLSMELPNVQDSDL